jgi:hypothetical protein
MSRREFKKSVRVQIIKRATIDGVTRCEECHAATTRFEVHHIKPDGLAVDKSAPLTAAEGICLCEPCHDRYTPKDVAAVAQAKRREAKYLGATRPAGQIKSRGFAKAEKPDKPPARTAPGMTNIARRFGLREN